MRFTITLPCFLLLFEPFSAPCGLAQASDTSLQRIESCYSTTQRARLFRDNPSRWTPTEVQAGKLLQNGFLAASGSSHVNGVPDSIVFQGTLVPASRPQESLSVTGEFLGTRKAYLAIEHNGQRRETIITSRAAALRSRGSITPEPAESFRDMVHILPFQTDLTSDDSTATAIVPNDSAGHRPLILNIPNSQLSELRIYTSSTRGDPEAKRAMGTTTETIAWLDPQTLDPLEVTTCVAARNDGAQLMPLTRVYSNFVVQNGHRYPRTVVQYLGNTEQFTLTVTTIQFGIPVQAADFTVTDSIGRQQ